MTARGPAPSFERGVDELTEDLKVAYILKDVEKPSEDEVSEILALPKFTMKHRVHRGLLVIRKRIEKRFFESRR